MKQRFPPSARVLRGADYKRCFAAGARHGSRYFRLHLLQPEILAAPADAVDSPLQVPDPAQLTSADPQPKPLPMVARLGLAVSRKFERRAVGRNRIKRLARERFRMLRATLQPGDYVVVPRREAAAAANEELGRDLDRLLQRAGALKGIGAQGTMPVLGGTSTRVATAADDAPNG